MKHKYLTTLSKEDHGLKSVILKSRKKLTTATFLFFDKISQNSGPNGNLPQHNKRNI